MRVKPEDIKQEYTLAPLGVLWMALGREDIARLVCSALERHMRHCKVFMYVDDEGLHFEGELEDGSIQ